MARIQTLSDEARPRARLLALGPRAISDEELVAIVLGQGARGHDPLEVARGVLADAGDLSGLCRLEAGELSRTGGVGLAQGARLVAAVELGRRSLIADLGPSPLLASAQDVYRLMLPLVAGRCQETFWALSLNSRHRLRRIHQVADGGLATVVVHPREVFGPLLRWGAAATILVHNHPSGDPEPSSEDIALTRRLSAVGALTGIPVLDHLVVVPGGYASLSEQGLV